MIIAVGCFCGSTDKTIRNTLQRFGYKDWLSIPIHRGKEASLRVLNSIPQHPEVDMLRNLIRENSKYAVILGYDDDACRWADIAHTPIKSKVEAEFIVKRFGQDSAEAVCPSAHDVVQ